MVFVGNRQPDPVTSREIAEASGVPLSYLSKIMQGLSRAELVSSRRGKKGGFTFNGPPTALTLYDIVQAVDPIKRIEKCPRDIDEHCVTMCPLHRFLDDRIKDLHDSFRSVSIADLMSGHPAIFPGLAEP